MMKKILAALLCAATVLTISGCGSEADIFDAINSAGGTDGSGSGSGTNKGKRPGESTTDSGIVYNSDGSIDWDSVPYADESDFEYLEIGDLFQGYIARIKRYNGNEKVIKIPETINGSPVYDLADPLEEAGVFRQASDIYVKTAKSMNGLWYCFYDCENVTLEITEPDDDFDFSKNSFKNCKNIKVNIPSSCKLRIAEEAFSNCTFNGSLTLPDNLTSMDKNCFGDPSKGNFPSSIIYRGETYDPEHFDKLLEAVAAANYVDPRPFDDGKLGHSTLKIYDPYGQGFDYLMGVPRDIEGTYTVPNNVIFIDDYAFIGCELLENVILHGNCEVGEKAFEGYNGNVTFRGKTYKASEFNYAEASKEPVEQTLTDWDSVPYAPDSDFEYEVLGMFMSKSVSIKKYNGTSKQVKIPETINGIEVGSLFGKAPYDAVFDSMPDIEVLLPEDVALRDVFSLCGGAKLYLPDTKIDLNGAMKVLESGTSVVYKGVVYDNAHMQEFNDAVNGNSGS